MSDTNGHERYDREADEYRDDPLPPPTDEQRVATSLIESKVNIDRLTGIEMAPDGSVATRNFAQVVEMAKTLSLAGSMVPRFMRGQVWTCAQIVAKAMEWGMSPLSVASMAYEVKNAKTGERTTAYMSQLLHAVVERRAPLKERLRVRYEGEGDDMVCIVLGTFKGEEEAREWRSEPLKAARAGKRSPLWQAKPRVQLWYDTSRDWIRVYCPDVSMGIYDEEEMRDSGFIDVTPRDNPPDEGGGLTQRLSESALARAGFSVGNLAAIDGGRRTAEASGGRPAAEPLTPAAVDQGGEVKGPPSTSSPTATLTEGSGTAKDEIEASVVPEGGESPVRAARGRRRAPDAAQPGLV